MRINELARELEVPSKQVVEALPKIGIADKKSHSSKVEADEVEKIRAHFRAIAEAENRPAAARPTRDGDELKPKFDLSHISKPGDVLKAIQQKQTEPPPRIAARPTAAAPARPAVTPAVPQRPATAAPSAPAAQRPAPAPRVVTP